MIATPAGPGVTGFAVKPEFILLGLGVLATLLIMGVFFWLIRGMIREDAMNNEDTEIDTEESP